MRFALIRGDSRLVFFIHPNLTISLPNWIVINTAEFLNKEHHHDPKLKDPGKKERCLLEEYHLPNFEPDTAIVMIRTTSPATILSSTEGAYFILDYCLYIIINAALTTKILLVIQIFE